MLQFGWLVHILMKSMLLFGDIHQNSKVFVKKTKHKVYSV